MDLSIQELEWGQDSMNKNLNNIPTIDPSKFEFANHADFSKDKKFYSFFSKCD